MTGIIAGAISSTPVYVDFTDLYSDIARYESPFMARVLVKLEGLVARRATRVIAVTNRMRTALLSVGVENSKLSVVPDGTDTRQFHPAVDGTRIRQELGLGDSPVLIFHGDIKYSDGVDILLLAFRDVLRAVPAAKLLIVGGGLQSAFLARAIAELGIGPSVVLTGWVPHSEVPYYIAAADVGAMPLRSTLQTNCYLSFKLFEYWGMGKPVVVSKVDSISEIATDNETAIFVSPGDVKSLATALTKALQDRKSLKFLAENARKLVETTFDWEIIMKHEASLYDNFVQSDLAKI